MYNLFFCFISLLLFSLIHQEFICYDFIYIVMKTTEHLQEFLDDLSPL